ncbi:hypothetical protein TwortDSMZ_206 [Staphylococcus phage Twort]|uniref:Terminal repeat-encoded protein I n=2 Tax=Staphylococcus phage Twort (strain DSM 17442 / HER 48) TaxID=2908167 RepID=A0A6H0X5K2_BPTWO|nr:ORF113 [Staphylococcus phage Twort]AAX92405.1 ORF113 [Staphylococcus phage Twort]QIW89028.1 terminal repeat-encoded protein I [Staphylococcus phage Twort]QIW89199.1 hypothetical protein TwortDSMZ_206 [Staphylococcus phage Twort]
MKTINGIKGLNNLPRWESQDIYATIQSYLRYNDMDSARIIVNNFQVHDYEDSNDMYYEVYTSEFVFDIDSTLEEFEYDIIRNEKLTKEYKTIKGLINACIRENSKKEMFTYNMFTII